MQRISTKLPYLYHSNALMVIMIESFSIPDLLEDTIRKFHYVCGVSIQLMC